MIPYGFLEGVPVQVNIVKRSSYRIPRQFLQDWMKRLVLEMGRTTDHGKVGKSLTIAFVEESEMKALNKQFRNKNKVTDVLSFEGFGDGDLGDLVLCGAVLQRQAQEHNFTSRQELGYLVIHGLLHLLGYEHEGAPKKAKLMFSLQDRLFDKLWPQFFEGSFYE